MYKRIIIKVGTHVITNDNGILDRSIMKGIVNQIAELKKKGMDIVVVSSGAVGAGKALVELDQKCDSVERRQVLAAVGQIPLMSAYSEFFKKHGMTCAQVLATKDDFRDRHHYLNMQNCFEGLIRENVIPIVNENDVVAVSDLMFTDNDEFAGLIAAMLNADAVAMLTAVDGIFDGDPDDPKAKLMHEIDVEKTDPKKFITPDKTKLGRGGMATKCKVAAKCASIGIAAHILNGKKENILLDLLEGREVGTAFLAQDRKLSPVKKWIAHSDGYEKGVIRLNECAEPVLRSEGKANSLLPVGIASVEGHFEKGDIIKIKNYKGEVVGLGRAEYDADMAMEYAGQKGKKELVHYDYLVLV